MSSVHLPGIYKNNKYPPPHYLLILFIIFLLLHAKRSHIPASLFDKRTQTTQLITTPNHNISQWHSQVKRVVPSLPSSFHWSISFFFTFQQKIGINSDIEVCSSICLSLGPSIVLFVSFRQTLIMN